MDDAYIVAHNARVLLEGSDPNYGVSALAGTTSPVHLALVAFLSIVLPIIRALELAGWIATLAFALGVAHLARAFRVPAPLAFALVVTALVAALVPHQLTNGLETGLMLAALTWAIALLVSDPFPGRGPALAALCGLLPFVRPDLIPAAGGILIAGFVRGRSGPVLRPRDLAFAVVAALPWAIWLWVELGTPYPMTAGAKRYFFAEANLPAKAKTAYVLIGFLEFAAQLGILCVGWVFLLMPRLRGRAAVAFVMFAPAFILAYWREFPGAFGQYEGRYLYALIPWLLAGIAGAIGATRFVLARVVGLVVLVVGLAPSLVNLPSHWKQHLDSRNYARDNLAGVANWMNENLPPGSKLLIHDAGYVAWGTDFPLADLVGLKSPQAIELHRSFSFPTNGVARAEAIHRFALGERPDYAVLLTGWDRIFKMADGLRAHGWRLDPLTQEKQFTYRVYRLTPPPQPGEAHGQETEPPRTPQLGDRQVREGGVREEAPEDDAEGTGPEPGAGRHGVREEEVARSGSI